MTAAKRRASCRALPNPWMNSRKRRKLRQRQMERALDLAYNALLAHPYWCGFNKDAPGDASYNEAIRALREVRRVGS